MPYLECEPQESALGPVSSECDQLDKPHLPGVDGQ